MNKYTAEQARSSLQKMLGHPLTVAERAELFSMASNYADLLRERESANNNDTCTDADCPRCNTPAQHRGDMSHAGIGCYPGRFCGEVVSRRIENGVDVFTIKPSFGDEFDVIKVSESAKAAVTDAMVNKAFGAFVHALKGEDTFDGLRAALKAVAPMLASVRVPDGWLPIESAPNDGTMHVRGLMVHGNDGKALYWDACAGHLDTEDGQFIDQGGNDFGWNADDFTHWHPLAAAPKPEKE